MLWCRKRLSIVLGPALVMAALAQDRVAARDMALVGFHDPQGRSTKGAQYIWRSNEHESESEPCPFYPFDPIKWLP
jgi:hypothetical protein